MVDNKKTEKKKGFFGRMFDALDKKMQESAQNSSCCCCGPASKDSKDKKCC